MDDELEESADPARAKSLIRGILEKGVFTYSRHALEEMQKDALTTVDCVNVLRAGVVRPPELDKGSWRYLVETARMAVVIAFRSRTELVVVTAWRKRK